MISLHIGDPKAQAARNRAILSFASSLRTVLDSETVDEIINGTFALISAKQFQQSQTTLPYKDYPRSDSLYPAPFETETAETASMMNLPPKAWRSGVYAVRCGKYVKMGTAASGRARFFSLRGANPYPLALLAYWEVIKKVDRYKLERSIHEQLSEFRRRGEWFEVDDQQIETAFGEHMLAEPIQL